MTEGSKDTGIIMVIMQRFEHERLPHALFLKNKVDQGETLSDIDIAYLDEVFEDLRRLKPLMDRHHEYDWLISQSIHLYMTITEKALENEQHA